MNAVRIFEAMMAADAANQRARALWELRVKIHTPMRCGDCRLWMTKACPREVHSNQSGRSTGPHCDAPTCAKFVQSSLSESRVEALRTQLSEMQRKSSGETEGL